MLNKKSDAWPQRQLTTGQKKFIQDGPGHDTEPQAQRDPEPTTRTTVVIPAELHRKFKALCAEEGKSMGAEIVRLMATRVGA